MTTLRFGIWILGVRGGVAASSIVGLVALRRNLTPPTVWSAHCPILQIYQSRSGTNWSSAVTKSATRRSKKLHRDNRVLAPMFAARNLEIMSWVGHNIFGNLVGKVLDDPLNKASKVRSKDQLLEQLIGYAPQSLVSIEHILSLGDWKTA